MHAHRVAPRAPPNRGELYRRKTLFLDDFPLVFVIQMRPGPTHPLPIFFWDFWNFLKLLQSPLGQTESTRKYANYAVCMDNN